MGADYIEPDLVSTKDGVLVARHENEISRHHRRGRPSRVRRPPDDQDDRRVASPAGSPRTSPSPSSRRCAPRSGSPPSARPTPPSTACTRSRPSRRSSTSPSARRVGIYPETKHPTYFRLDRPVAGGAAGAGAARQRLPRPRRRRCSSSPSRSATCSDLNRMTDVRSSSCIDATGRPYDFVVAGDPRTYADLVTPAGLGRSPPTPTASGRTRT